MNFMPRFHESTQATDGNDQRRGAGSPAVTPARVAAAFAGWSASPIRRDWTVPSVRAWHNSATR